MSRKRRLERESVKPGKSLISKTFAGMKVPKNLKLVPGPIGVKMSDVLLDFVTPYVDSWENEDHLNKLLTLALIAWDAANLPIDKRQDLIEHTLQALPDEIRSDGRAILAGMIRRKEASFADNKRTIINCKVTMTPAGPHLHVVSMPAPV